MNEDLDQRPADCYAFGKLCWSLLAGRPALSREAQLTPENRLEVLLGVPALARLHPLFARLLTVDPRGRLVDWQTILREIEGVRAELDGTHDQQQADEFDLTAAVAKARMLAADAAMIQVRQAAEHETARRPYEMALREVIEAEFSRRLHLPVQQMNEVSDGKLDFRLGSGRSMQDLLSRDLIELIGLDPLPPLFLNQTPAMALTLAQWGESNESSVLQLLVLLIREQEQVWLAQTPMRRKEHYEYPLLATDLGHLIRREGPFELRLATTTDHVRQFAITAAEEGKRLMARYVDLVHAGKAISDTANWLGL